MHYLDNVTATTRLIRGWRDDNKTVALVPTLGNLHTGHMSLVRKARQNADRTVVSIFVNPTQFVEGEDFESYPRTHEADLEQLRAENVDLAFCPPVSSIYFDTDEQTRVTVTGMEDRHCGASRPGHFAGVATIVLKLFNIIRPDVAIFGEKDYQQLLVISQMVKDLFIPVEIISAPTVREPDGLAISSRNQYLDEKQRKIAPNLYRVLQETASEISSGNTNFLQLEKQATDTLDQYGFQTDYFAICDAATLGPPGEEDIVILSAAFLGRARLIDNVLFRR